MTSAEMRKSCHKPGYRWTNVAPLGSDPDWREEVEPTARGDDTLFGYDRRAFMAKQYK